MGRIFYEYGVYTTVYTTPYQQRKRLKIPSLDRNIPWILVYDIPWVCNNLALISIGPSLNFFFLFFSSFFSFLAQIRKKGERKKSPFHPTSCLCICTAEWMFGPELYTSQPHLPLVVIEQNRNSLLHYWLAGFVHSPRSPDLPRVNSWRQIRERNSDCAARMRLSNSWRPIFLLWTL
jgi:hypothetical protein